MGENFAHGFKEIFHCKVKGTDIVDARFNAWSALALAIAEKSPKHHWKLSQMQHDLSAEEDEEENVVPIVVCEAVWVYDPDSDGGKGAELIEPITPDPDGIEQPELHLVEND